MPVILLRSFIAATFFVALGYVWWCRRHPAAASRLGWQDVERRMVPWGLADVMVVLAFYAVANALARAVLWRTHGIELEATFADLTPQEVATVTIGGSVAGVATVAAALFALRWRGRETRWRDLGWDAACWQSDLLLGLLAFALLAPPVYLLQFVLVHWFESQHPLALLIRESRSPYFLVVTAGTALVVAPLVEEFLFRVILQGWLDRLAAEPLEQDATRTGGGQHLRLHGDQLPAWPIVVSAAVFALLHLGHGPDWVPLFVLAVGLGYIYRRTHRILPCIVVHFLLNFFSLLELLLL